MKIYNLLCIAALSFLALSCGSSSKEKKAECEAPKPEAVFSESLDGIRTHSFALSGHNSEEQLQFEDGTALTLFQSGCEKIVQEFRFTLPEKLDEDRTILAIDRLLFLAKMDDKYMAFANWAQAIEGLQAQFAEQDEVEVEQGFFVGLDKISSSDQTILVIKLFQK